MSVINNYVDFYRSCGTQTGSNRVTVCGQIIDTKWKWGTNIPGVRAPTLISFKKALVTKYYPIYQHQQSNIKTFLFALHLSVYISGPSCSKLG